MTGSAIIVAMDNEIDKQENTNPEHRRIRSFVLRQGRVTKGQANALETQWP